MTLVTVCAKCWVRISARAVGEEQICFCAKCGEVEGETHQLPEAEVTE